MKKFHQKSGIAKTVNQPMRFRKQRRNKNGEKLKQLCFKSHGCTMLLFSNITAINARGRINALKAMYDDWKGEFIIIQ